MSENSSVNDGVEENSQENEENKSKNGTNDKSEIEMLTVIASANDTHISESDTFNNGSNFNLDRNPSSENNETGTAPIQDLINSISDIKNNEEKKDETINATSDKSETVKSTGIVNSNDTDISESGTFNNGSNIGTGTTTSQDILHSIPKRSSNNYEGINSSRNIEGIGNKNSLEINVAVKCIESGNNPQEPRNIPLMTEQEKSTMENNENQPKAESHTSPKLKKSKKSFLDSFFNCYFGYFLIRCFGKFLIRIKYPLNIILGLLNKSGIFNWTSGVISHFQQNALQPMGFKNPKGYCYLNCVIQLLASCKDFGKDIEKLNWKRFDETEDSIFVNSLFDLIKALRNSDESALNEALKTVQKYVTESSLGDDVYKCFMNILSRVSTVLKATHTETSNLHATLSDKAQGNFEKFKKETPGFVFDNFYGQLAFHMTCNVCQQIFNESFQVLKSISLAVPVSESPILLNQCIELFFSDSQVQSMKPWNCNCENGSVKSCIKLIHSPKYLFIYLNRGSYTDNGAKIDTFVTCAEKSIELKDSTNNAIKYKLISVIDHVGNTFSGHYYCRSNFEGSDWWLLNDAHVEKYSDDEVVTKNTIIFLFKREIELSVM